VEEQISRGQRAEDIYLHDTESGEKISRGFLEDRYLEDRERRIFIYMTQRVEKRYLEDFWRTDI
jgi:hypothetical protein